MEIHTTTAAESDTPPPLAPTASNGAGPSLRRRFSSGAIWSLAAAVMTSLANLLAGIICARILGKQHYGELTMIQSTVATFGIFAGLGLGVTGTRYVARSRSEAPVLGARILGLCTAVALIWGGGMAAALYLFAPFVARTILAEPALAGILAVSAPLLILGALEGLKRGALVGLEAFRTIAWISLVAGISQVTITTLATLRFGVVGGMYGLITSMSVCLILESWALRGLTHRIGMVTAWSECWGEWPVLVRFTLPAFLTGVLAAPVWLIGKSLLVRQPSGYAENGIFSAAGQWQTMVGFIPTVLASMSLPLLASLVEAQDRRGYLRVLSATIKTAMGGSLLVCIAVIAASPIIMSAYGSGFANGAVVLCLLAIAGLLSGAAALLSQIIAGSGSMWWALALNGLWAVVFVASAYYWIHLGALGLAYAFVASYFIHIILTSIYTFRIVVPASFSE